MKISVIIPTYKPQNYIWDCLDSLCAQSFPKKDFEIVLVLNGCNEPYNSQLNEYMSLHSEINWNYSQLDKGGVSNARNIALCKSVGEYITFIDDDDYVSSSYLEGMYEVAIQGYTAVAKIVGLDDKSKKISPTRTTKLFESLQSLPHFGIKEGRRFLNSPVMKLIKRTYIEGRHYDVRFANGEDVLFMFNISDRMRTFKCTCPDAIYYRRYREGSAISNLTKISVLVKNSFLLSVAFFSVWIKRPTKYNFVFFITRIAAPFKEVFFKILKK